MEHAPRTRFSRNYVIILYIYNCAGNVYKSKRDIYLYLLIIRNYTENEIDEFVDWFFQVLPRQAKCERGESRRTLLTRDTHCIFLVMHVCIIPSEIDNNVFRHSVYVSRCLFSHSRLDRALFLSFMQTRVPRKIPPPKIISSL